jgi:hypothetical protein
MSAKITALLISKPCLARYVKRIELCEWTALVEYVPAPYHPSERASVLVSIQATETSRIEYKMLTEAAKSAGVISNIFPYEERSRVNQAARDLAILGPIDETWFENLFDPVKRIRNIPYDSKFCQLLRADLEDPLVALLLALLPNVQELWLSSAPMASISTLLPWHLPNHGFNNLKRLAVSSEDRRAWHITFFDSILDNGNLEVLEASCGGTLFRNCTDKPHIANVQPFSLQAGRMQLRT